MPSPTTDQPELSKCHKSPVSVRGGDGGTSYWVCETCHQPCDLYVDQPDVELTKRIYEAMQIPYLSERHDAIKKIIEAEKSAAIQAFGEKQIEAFEKAIYRYELTRDYPEGNLSKPIMEYYRTSIQETMQSTSPDGSAA